MRAWARQGGGFLSVGLLNSALTFVVYEALLFVLSYRLAYTLAFMLGIVFSAAMNARVVFDTKLTLMSFLRFVVVYLLNYGLGLLVVSVLVEQVHVRPAVAPLLTAVILMPVSFFGSRFALRTADATLGARTHAPQSSS